METVMSLIATLSTKQKVELLKELYHDIAGKGQDGDTMLAHINPEEALLLKAYGGSGTINPYTGLPEYKKAVKKIATVAAIAFGGYAAFGLGSLGSFGYMGSGLGSFAKLATTGLSLSQATSIAGLGLQVASSLQARKYAGQQSKFEAARVAEAKKLEESRQRQSEVEARQARLAQVREQRIRTGQVVAATGGAGLGMAGTSSFTGAVGSMATQAAANIGQINVAQGFAQEQSGYNIAAAEAASKGYQSGVQASQWQNMGTLASGMSKDFINIFNV